MQAVQYYQKYHLALGATSKGGYSMGQCSFVWFDTESQPKPRNFEILWILVKVAVASLWGA